MKEKTRYTDEPMQVGRMLRDLLPPPESLVPKEDAVKVTISLSARSIHFFKAEAAKGGVQYQRMIRRVLDAYVEAFDDASTRRVEEPLPHGRLAQHVIVHQWQVIRTLRTMLKSDPQAAVGSSNGKRFPKREELRHEIFKRLIHWMTAALFDGRFDHRAWETTDVFYTNMGGDFDGTLPGGARVFRLTRIKRVAIIDANR